MGGAWEVRGGCVGGAWEVQPEDLPLPQHVVREYEAVRCFPRRAEAVPVTPSPVPIAASSMCVPVDPPVNPFALRRGLVARRGGGLLRKAVWLHEFAVLVRDL